VIRAPSLLVLAPAADELPVEALLNLGERRVKTV
jgi:hypothetical protein